MGLKKMTRDEADEAAREHLAGMPAWQGRDRLQMERSDT